MQSAISLIDDLKYRINQLSSNQEIEELMTTLKAREEQIKNASSSSMNIDSKNISSATFLPIGFSNALQSVDENSKNIIKSATPNLELNTKNVRWLSTIESGDIYNVMSKKYRNLAGKAQRIAKNATKPLLYMSGSALRAQTGLSQLVNTGIREGLVNSLKQLAMPSCSIDMTTIIPSMIRPRY